MDTVFIRKLQTLSSVWKEWADSHGTPMQKTLAVCAEQLDKYIQDEKIRLLTEENTRLKTKV